MELIFSTIQSAFGNYNYLICLCGCIILGFVISQKRRKSFWIPIIVLTVIILTPLYYKFWDMTNGSYAFWRALWMLPIIPACACIPAIIVDRVNKDIVRVFAVIAFTAVFALLGSLVYAYAGTSFSQATNSDKLPEDVVEVAEYLLKADDHPSVVSDSSISIYIRQYSGKFRSPYARDVTYGTPTKLGKRIYDSLNAGDMREVAQQMLNYDYKFLVTQNVSEGRQEAILDAGFEQVNQIGDYGIYIVHGIRTEKRTYNERFQVTCLTTVDENGDPILNDAGFSTVHFEYDNYGNVIYEYRTDITGQGVADEDGHAGYIRKYNRFNQVVEEQYLGMNGEVIQEGMAIRVCQYNKDRKLIEEEFYDRDRNPVEVGGIGYTKVQYEYTGDNQLSLVYYYDVFGDRLLAGSSYLHEYLNGLKEETGLTVFVSAKDEATNALTETIIEDLWNLGLQTDLIGKRRYSYIAVVSDSEVFELLDENKAEHSGVVNGMPFYIESAGYDSGNTSSIIVDDIELSTNVRGLNFVVFKNGEFYESVGFDTHSQEMKVTKTR